MTGLVDSAAAILSNGEKRLQAISQNISNAGTPGYKRQIAFSQLLETKNSGDYSVPISVSIDNSSGKFTESGNPLDLAIVGPAMFMLRDGDRFFYARGGQFSRDSEGALVNAQGMRLQQAGGGDMFVDRAAIEILGDGTVLSDGSPIGSVGLFEAESTDALDHLGGSLFSATNQAIVETSGSAVRQGVIESSNVQLSDEMVNLMANNRQVEMGGQLVRTYDQLMGQAITVFTRSGR
ncbi:MAG: flagellar hook basal-body protein [Sphingorhabdus sp.]|uniref:flagellar hook-basal body protein n=1 Tax=Sphingorhabdus sp. TaxID=1902408 RepID=UPI003C86EB5E